MHYELCETLAHREQEAAHFSLHTHVPDRNNRDIFREDSSLPVTSALQQFLC